MENKRIKLGIGFATGRKNFRKVLSSYIYGWNEAFGRMNLKEEVSLTLFVAYDVDYSKTQSTDYTNLNQDTIDSFEEIVFFGAKHAQSNVKRLIDDEKMTENDAKLLFSKGYAGKRNAILFGAIEKGMDYILFLDDDEYPVAVTNNHGHCLWSGQYVLPIHLDNIKNADITNGYHCGYISPIPDIKFQEDSMVESLSERDFGSFIQAISNDIVNWENVKKIMKSGGVTYAGVDVLVTGDTKEVEEINKCKFISGSNLCINLTKPERVFPFYNPPGARGEDTFLSTMLSERKVLKVPCFTFHDGFSAYRHILDGALPIELAAVTSKTNAIVDRFAKACIGWVRYKPLLMYLTEPENFTNEALKIQKVLDQITPKLSTYFNSTAFNDVPLQFKKYCKNVKAHASQLAAIKEAWKNLMDLER